MILATSDFPMRGKFSQREFGRFFLQYRGKVARVRYFQSPEIEEFYSLLSQCRQNHPARFHLLSSPFLKILTPSRVANHRYERWWARGTVGKGEICKPKRIRVILLRAFSKSTPSPFLARLGGSATEGEEDGIHPTSGKKPTTVDEHSVNGSPSLFLFSRFPSLAGADDAFFRAWS